jgi:elongation factor G
LRERVDVKRAEMIQALAQTNDLFLHRTTHHYVRHRHRHASRYRGLDFTPVLVYSALKNTGIRPLLGGVCACLLNLAEGPSEALDTPLSASAPPLPSDSLAGLRLLTFRSRPAMPGTVT